MSDTDAMDWGPLDGLTGTWKGDRGLDVAPEPDGPDETPYYETIDFTPVPGPVENAESQVLACVRYSLVVRRKSNDEVFHDQTGYWMWEASTGTLMQSVSIPRAVCVLAAGSVKEEDGKLVFRVEAALGKEDWGVLQSPFMRENARTRAYEHTMTLDGDRLAYRETTLVDIYGREFEHTDANELVRADQG